MLRLWLLPVVVTLTMRLLTGLRLCRHVHHKSPYDLSLSVKNVGSLRVRHAYNNNIQSKEDRGSTHPDLYISIEFYDQESVGKLQSQEIFINRPVPPEVLQDDEKIL